MSQLAGDLRITPSFSDRCKRALLGRPMINDQLQHERLSNPIALGVLSPDAISSTAYGSEQVMIELLPAAGMAAFALLLPITGVILLILVLVAASYRQVVAVYTRAGGSYVVARDNFGPKVAQVAAASLLIDYVVTVAVQCAAGNGGGRVGGPRTGSVQPGDHRRHCAADVLCQPARIAGSRIGHSRCRPICLSSMVSLTIVVGVVRELLRGPDGITTRPTSPGRWRCITATD